MRFEIVLVPQAVRDLRALPARHLRHEPDKLSKSRIKRLRGVRKPQFRLRVGEVRVFYDVRDEAVEVLAIVSKDQAQAWLEDHGTPDADRSSREGQG